MDKKCYIIILAGGAGTRMGGSVAKQFLDLGGKPVLVHTIEAFRRLAFPIEIILVLPKIYRDYWKEYCEKNSYIFRHTLVSGGITRFHSVKNALKYVPKGAIVAVHDGVRPFVPKDLLEQMFGLTDHHNAVVPFIKPADSMRIVKGETSKIVNRDDYIMIQTPQIFHSEVILEAYEQPYSQNFTDDASVVESIEIPIHLTQGSITNLKITRPEDLKLAEAILTFFK